MKKLILLVFILVCSSTAFSQSTAQTVTIGDQVWTTKNLNVDKFRNGDPIPEAKTEEEWIKAGKNKQPAWCYYDNDPSNGEKYGKLYNWYAVNDVRGLAPVGWHIPRDVEWTVLSNFLGGEKQAGAKMKSTAGWIQGNGSNTSGFTGLPGGYRLYNGGFNDFGNSGYWWSSSESNESDAWYRKLYNHNYVFFRTNYLKNNGLPVRCVRD